MPDVTAIYGKPFDLVVFLGIFIHFWREFMSEVLYCILTVGYGRFSDLIAVLGIFNYYYKLSKVMCQGRSVETESKLM